MLKLKLLFSVESGEEILPVKATFFDKFLPKIAWSSGRTLSQVVCISRLESASVSLISSVEIVRSG